MKTNLTWFERMMIAVSFAEANAPEIGLEYLPEKKMSRKAVNGLRRVPVTPACCVKR